jgi:hypothetical protein
MERTERDTIAEWFANNWLLVAENDYDTYRSLIEQEGEGVVAISDTLREEWETLADQVSELAEENISETAGLFIRQILQGWGSYPFDLIARRVLEMKAEVNA